MRILAIRGKNLASLAGEFEVDFTAEPLAGAGLFAICGPTGAGKSTLLDALCLALYDATPRLAGADTRGIELPDVGKETTLPNDRRNILRRGCAEGHAEVDFVGNDGVACRARWSVRRARSRSDGRLQAAEMSLLRIADGQPLCGRLKSDVHRAIGERIGLSFEQFTRAVLLAQNEFFTFLKAGEDERAALLQTLTGTDRFEAISRRAYERNKAEQEKLRALRDRLADQQALGAEQRAAVEAERAEVRDTVAKLEARSEALAVRLRWHEEDERLRLREGAARQALDDARTRRAAAAPREAALARVEAVQPARALLAETARLARQRTALAAQQTETVAALATATRATEEAATGERQARQALAEAEAAHAGLAPLIARARQLDTELGALAPAHAKAADAEAQARAAADALRHKLTAAHGARDSAAKALEATRAWLAARQDQAPLAEGWMRWDALLAGACDEHARGREASAEAARLTALARREAAAIETAASHQAATAKAVAERETQARAAAEALAGIDADAVARRRAEVDARGEVLHVAAQAWHDLVHFRREADELAAQGKAIADAQVAQRAALDGVRARRPAADAAAAQAEHAWKVVFEATRADVESLRGSLVADAPCPVCGSTSHPYVSHHPGLDDALTRLAEARDRCRHTATALAAEEQAAVARLASLDEQRTALEARQRRRAAEMARALAIWRDAAARLAQSAACPPPAAGDTDDGDGESWLAARTTELEAARRQAVEDETRLREAGARRQAAQTALDAARRLDAEAHDALARLRADAARTEAALAAARDAIAAGAVRLNAVLDQLDGARPPACADLAPTGVAVPAAGDEGAEAPCAVRRHRDGLTEPSALGDTTLTATSAARVATAEGGWRGAWTADPAAYHQRCRAIAQTWLDKKQTATTLEQKAATLATEAEGLAQLLAQAERRHHEAAREVDEQARALAAKREARRAVFAGRRLSAGGVTHTFDALGADEVERAVGAARAAAQAELARRQDAVKTAEAERARVDATAAQLARQALAVDREAAQAASALADWLAAFNAARPAEDALDDAGLAALLTRDAAWIAAEREALRQLDAAVATAQGGLDQILAQRAAHQQARPTPTEADEAGAEAVREALAQLADALRAERERLGNLELALRSDDEVRARAAALVATIEAQEAEARIWWQLNELIGSADGKKFRNYAQQLTLDVLLGYANAHLRDLARRYRLERVPATLALMVVDQDMGDEQRSVHSLSGGESFLVSLALALGLASLSSHRVRVESLFIDEGFGSLDADTLRVAMDALDRLQALGRKVGVISHVAEMTERIGTRIEVRRLAGGRSEVVVGQRP